MKPPWDQFIDLQTTLIVAMLKKDCGREFATDMLKTQIESDAERIEQWRFRCSEQLWFSMQLWHCANQLASEWAAANIAASGGEAGGP